MTFTLPGAAIVSRINLAEDAAKRAAAEGLVRLKRYEQESGVSLRDVAMQFEADDIAATKRVKRWSDSGKITATPLGKCPLEGRCSLYRLSEILADVAKILSLDSDEQAKYSQALTTKLRTPAAK